MRRLRQLDVPTLRAAWWTLRASHRARRHLARGRRVDELRLPATPTLPASAERGVMAVLRRRESPCLEASLVRQAWHAAQGSPRDLFIGVTAPGGGLEAHAWLEGDSSPETVQFRELLRQPPR